MAGWFASDSEEKLLLLLGRDCNGVTGGQLDWLLVTHSHVPCQQASLNGKSHLHTHITHKGQAEFAGSVMLFGSQTNGGLAADLSY